MANKIAGQNPPNALNVGIDPFQYTLNASMTPGYTGGFMGQNPYGNLLESEDPNVKMFGALGQIQNLSEQRAFEREQNLFNQIQAMRKREAKEAYQMQLPFRIGNQVTNIFQGIQQAVAPAKAYELAIRSRTPELMAQMYAANTAPGRKWLSS